MGPHFDSNRSYLSQRHYTAVVHLTTQGKDYEGGTFEFQDQGVTGDDSERDSLSSSSSRHPSSFFREGTAVLYTSGAENVHSVSEIKAGKRMTFSMWFSRHLQACEDVKFLFPERGRTEGVEEIIDSSSGYSSHPSSSSGSSARHHKESGAVESNNVPFSVLTPLRLFLPLSLSPPFSSPSLPLILTV